MSKKALLLSVLQESVDKCYQNDIVLINRSMEQASVARIYYYMQNALLEDSSFEDFSEYFLDCEYNKNGDYIKSTPRCPNGTRPDIILHKRNNNDGNLLVIEFKPRKSNIKIHQPTNMPIDFVKLEDFTCHDVYNYFLGVFVKLNKKGPKYTYFQNGTQKLETELLNE